MQVRVGLGERETITAATGKLYGQQVCPDLPNKYSKGFQGGGIRLALLRRESTCELQKKHFLGFVCILVSNSKRSPATFLFRWPYSQKTEKVYVL